VAKAFTILRAIAAAGRDMTATELAHAVGSNVATVHRFLLTLESEGAVSRSQNGRFHLGHALADLGGRVEGDALLIDAVQPRLDALAGEFREAVHCVARSGNQAINAARAIPDRSLVISQPIGEPFPLHCTAAGKIFLASMSPANRRSFLAKLNLQRFTDATIIEPEALERELTQVSRQGYAVDEQEWEEGLVSIAAPLHNAKGAVVAAVALSAPVSRLTEKLRARALEAIRATIGDVERSLFTQSRIFPSRARPRGSFPHLKRVGDFLFVSGTSARRPDDSFEGVTVDRGQISIDIRKQAGFVFEAIRDMLQSVGSGLEDLVDVQAFLLDMADYPAFNQVYAQFFPPDGPTRTTVAVRELPHPHQGLMVRAVAFQPHSHFEVETG
jgi:2-aminomuconate deaminase